MKISRHCLLLAGILLLGTVLRFWNLDAKPMWLDEVITALFSLGRDYYQIPLEQPFAVELFDQLFTLKPETSCPQIVQTVSTQSVHPPLFFCWLHNWLSWTAAFPQSWVWRIRAFPALLGVLAIAAIYQLNRIAFSAQAGLLGAMVIAVSPFAVYLSQEARHYTLPMLLVILALLGLYHILLDIQQYQFRPILWFGWVVVNSIGFYVHYFFLLAFLAQAVTLAFLGRRKWGKVGEMGEMGESIPPNPLLPSFLLPIAAVCFTYLPWLPTFLSHITRPETDWLESSRSGWLAAIAPLYQLIIGWVLMVVALPVENQPIWIAAPAALLMMLFTGWLAWQMSSRLRQLWIAPATHLATRMFGVFLLTVLLEFLAIAYVLGKDLTLIPRYNFIYFPAVCALLGAGLGERKKEQRTRQTHLTPHTSHLPISPISSTSPSLFSLPLIWAVLLIGILSSAAVVSDLAFQKPYQPQQVAANMRVEPNAPLLVSMGYRDWQDVALGLSFALALRQQDLQAENGRSRSQFVFLKRHSYEQVWQTLSNLKHSLSLPLHLWIIAPGLTRSDYPAQLAFSNPSGPRSTCQLDSNHHHRIGVPYQLYRCS